MDIYFGSSCIAKAKSGLKKQFILFQSKNILVISDKPFVALCLKGNRRVFIWGMIYAVKSHNGTYAPSNIASDRGKAILEHTFENHMIEDIPKYLEGNFIGISIYGSNKAVIFGDAFNRTEAFYAFKSKEAIVSSDLEKIVKLIGGVHYSQEALAGLLTVYGGCVPKKHTIYKEIKRLGVGEYLVFDNNAIRIKEIEFTPVNSRQFGEREHREYADILEDAVRIRSSNHCNWIFLSSGWDSTALLAILAKHNRKSKVRGIIGQMNYSARSGTINQFEVDRAKKFAQYYKIQVDIVPLDLCNQGAVDYWKIIRAPLRRQHIYTITAYNPYRLSDFVLKHGSAKDAVFSGEISDGAHNLGFSQFATILDHPDLGFREYSDKMASYLYGAKFFGRVINNDYKSDIVYKFLKERLKPAIFDDKSDLHKKQRCFKYLSSFFLGSKRMPFYSVLNKKMLTYDGAKKFENEIYRIYLRDAVDSLTPETLYAWMLYLYNSFHWQSSAVRTFETRLVAGAMKIRSPFWDGRLQRFLSEMPENWGRGLELKPTKYPLKWMLANNLDYPIDFQTGPHSYLYDVNHGFCHFNEILFESFVSTYFKELIKGYPYESILQEDYFNLQYMRKIVDAYLNGTELIGTECTDLMSLVTLCLIGWY
ncbi:hypothetical protein KKC91_00980 [bacterium]|nr:hypothetical protein [bacterium]